MLMPTDKPRRGLCIFIISVALVAVLLGILIPAEAGTQMKANAFSSAGPAPADVAPSTNYLANVMDQFHSTYDVYTDADAAGNHFAKRAKMSSDYDADAVPDMNELINDNPHSGITCIQASFKSWGQNWGGWYFMNGVLQGDDTVPEPNWGTYPNAGIDLQGATKLTFWARGAVGGERVEFFCLGVGRDSDTGQPLKPYPDSSPKATTHFVTLTSNWSQYTINLTGKDLSYVLGGFGWVASASENANQNITFFMDDIRYDKARLAEPHFLVSYETVNSTIDFDKVLRNVAFTYDNAVALLAFLASGETGRAKMLADALVYAQQHDRFYNDGRIRNAYQAGDLALPPGWTPQGISGTVRMPGWYDSQRANWNEDASQLSTSAGNVAWAMLALLSYYETAGGPEYLDAAIKMGDWVEGNCQDTQGAGGYTAGFEGKEPNAVKLTYKATEHNIDLYTAFQRLYLLTGNTTWHDRAEHAKAFVQAMWDESEGKFWTGTQEDGITISKSVIPLDIQSWSLLALKEGGAAYQSALDYVESNHKVGSGYDFNTDCDGIWYEGTAQMATVYCAVGNLEKWHTIVSALEDAQLSSGGMFAADKDGLTTGFDLPDGNGKPWLYYQRAHVGATAWLVLAEQGVNPFWTVFNPAPSISSLDPVHTTAGDAAFTLTLNGTGFVSSSQVKWNGDDKTTHDTSDTEITADIPATDITTAGTATVTVVNPTPGGGPSNSLNFTINPKPSITSLSPTSGTTGSVEYVSGHNFGSSRGSSYVKFGSTKVGTYYSWTSTKIKVKAPSGISRTSSVVVHTSAGTSNAKTFKVIPKITAIFPTSIKVEAKVTIAGSAFGSKMYSGTYVKFGSRKVSKYYSWSNTKIVVKVPSEVSGKVYIKVTTSGGTSAGKYFTVKR